MSTNDKIESINTLRGLRSLLSQDEAGLQQFVYQHLIFGDIWWIPDAFTGVGVKNRHPWVIVQAYSDSRPSVTACIRTTKNQNPRFGIIMPAGVVDGLDRTGLIKLRYRRTFIAREFRDFEYVGRLPDKWIRKIQDFYATIAKVGTGR